MRELKERPKEKAMTGDLVVLKHKKHIYYPARLIDVQRKGRYKLIATIEFKGWTAKYSKGKHYQKKCHYNKLTKVRKDYWWEVLANKFKKNKFNA